jgi:hypothetical protein
MIMRLITLFIIPLMISSCGIKADKAAQKEESSKQEYLQKGVEIVSLTQSELLKNVSHAMKTGGPGYAIDYCNLRAMALKDSLSSLNNCQIRRIAIKYRNPIDMAQTEMEKEQLFKYQDAHQKGESLDPEIYLFDDRIEYYQPIFLDKGACLVCHGSPGTQIAEETMEKIMASYPNDLATGFALNDFRGAWKITFMKGENLKVSK